MDDVESGPPKVQQEPSDALQTVVKNNGAENVPKDEPGASSPDCLVPVQENPEQPHQDDAEHLGAKLSIYRIPDYLKQGDVKAYVPQIISLGPYHHGKEKLLPMEQHKLRCLHRILKRYNHNIGLYLESVRKVKESALTCYEGTIFMSSDSFVRMLVLDGCFVIELLRGVDKGFDKLGYDCNDPVFSKWGSMLKIQIQRDMIMLENQIPLFILARLLGLQLGDPNQEGRVRKLALKFFAPLIEQSSNVVSSDCLSDQCGLHCLGMFWRSLLPSPLPQGRNNEWLQNRQRFIPCLAKLREAGIKFRRPTRTNRLGDITFDIFTGILDIPHLVIHESTRSLFLNLIAFEQSHFDCVNHITSYIIFMQNLINSPEDVQYLCNHDIIEHCLGSDAEVADLFHRLCQELALEIRDSSLYELSGDVNHYYAWQHFPWRISQRARLAQKWNAWRAILKNKYFDNPWSIISFIAAFILLVLTFVQALYAVYSYYTPRS